MKYSALGLSFRILSIALLLSTVSSLADAQKSPASYSGALEYSIPLLHSVPPVYAGQPTDVYKAYLWLDQLMRSTGRKSIDAYLTALEYGDTTKLLASMTYQIIDDNPISFLRWNASALPRLGARPLPGGYRASPGHERECFQNQVGSVFKDSGRTGFLLACDLIEDVLIMDTAITTRSNKEIAHMVLVQSTILDTIKGRVIPGCPKFESKSDVRRAQSSSDSTEVIPCVPLAATPGGCLLFEYSPEWQRGRFSDAEDPSALLIDANGWWVKPGGEYIVFLYLAGIGGDSAMQYFTVNPFWGVFGTSGAIYRVQNGIVIDPNDDFGLGGISLSVQDWKTRLRGRIGKIIEH